MGARAVSPGGALLRSSRLFSLPRAIPDKQIPYELKIQKPESSTKPHPTHQSITSPQTSREKGDWGLKRPLPLKQTMATTTPLLKIKQLDSVERVTDYGSSADHALTLEKFNEMHMSMSVPRPTHDPQGATKAVRMSAFEEAYDFTVTPEDDPNRKGWKFKGPWLASMPEGEFETFVKKMVLPRRAEFRKLMRVTAAYELTLENKRAAQEAGSVAPPPTEPKDVTDDQLGDYMRVLRHHRAKLYKFVTNFLDLPPLHVPVGLNEAMNVIPQQGSRRLPPNMMFDALGPPPSHPSAGLSYLRTHAFMENHFLYGPQAQKKPVLGRLLQPQYGRKPVMVGVGGFVVEAPTGWNEMNLRRFTKNRRDLKGVQHLDIQSHGGAKAWVVPDKAFVDPNGMVVLQVADARDETRMVAMERAGRPVVYNSRKEKTNVEEAEREAARYDRTVETLVDDVEEQEEPGRDVMGSASAYGMDEPIKHSPY